MPSITDANPIIVADSTAADPQSNRRKASSLTDAQRESMLYEARSTWHQSQAICIGFLEKAGMAVDKEKMALSLNIEIGDQLDVANPQQKIVLPAYYDSDDIRYEVATLCFRVARMSYKAKGDKPTDPPHCEIVHRLERPGAHAALEMGRENAFAGIVLGKKPKKDAKAADVFREKLMATCFDSENAPGAALRGRLMDSVELYGKIRRLQKQKIGVDGLNDEEIALFPFIYFVIRKGRVDTMVKITSAPDDEIVTFVRQKIEEDGGYRILEQLRGLFDASVDDTEERFSDLSTHLGDSGVGLLGAIRARSNVNKANGDRTGANADQRTVLLTDADRSRFLDLLLSNECRHIKLDLDHIIELVEDAVYLEEQKALMPKALAACRSQRTLEDFGISDTLRRT